jgi:predicted  nucleic acid-binding Zn-ribbon protein
MRRLGGEIDQANRRIADHQRRIANENVTIARKTQEWHQVAARPQSSSTASQLRSIQSTIDHCHRNNAGFVQKIAQEHATIARKTAEYNRYAAKP